MPLVTSKYNPPFFLKNGHFSTIYAGLLRKSPHNNLQRERLILSDGDFLDLDWSLAKAATSNLLILLHGLEGNAGRPYIQGSANLFNKNKFDAVCVNFRSCSGEPNLLYRSYHSGATEDLKEVVNHVLELDKYKSVFIKGFSLGGNLTLKYMGEENRLPTAIKGAVAVSAPCFLYGSMLEIHKKNNIPYAARFKKKLLAKLREKQRSFPEKVSTEQIKAIKTLKQFDDFYTSTAHGFKDAIDYYTKCSSLQYLKNIDRASLLINAKNDSFLSEECFPFKEAEKNRDFYMETPLYGGHVGFYDQNNVYYNEKQALRFIQEKFKNEI